MKVKAKIISIKRARNKFGRCEHHHMIVDEEKNVVECEDCGAELNPVWALLRFANEESRWEHNHKALKEVEARLDQKKRAKCEHCGRMTRLHVR